MKVRDAMTREVSSVQTGTSLIDALEQMIDRRISGMPVLDEANRLVGIVTEGDLLRRAETGTEVHRPGWLQFLTGSNRLATEYIHAHGRRIEELMTPAPSTIGPDGTLEEAVALMLKHRVKRLPVVEGDRLVGIISRADLLKAVSRQLKKEAGAPLTDDAIATAIYAEIDKQQWAPRNSVTVTVKDGVVEFSGVITSYAAAPALRVIAENLPGVKAVVDRLVWIDPVSGVSLPSNEEATPQTQQP